MVKQSGNRPDDSEGHYTGVRFNPTSIYDPSSPLHPVLDSGLRCVTVRLGAGTRSVPWSRRGSRWVSVSFPLHFAHVGSFLIKYPSSV